MANALATILERLNAMETRLASSPMDTSPVEDPYSTELGPDTEFRPYPAFRQALPGATKDFFPSSLPEIQHKQFIYECPRNLERYYSATPINQTKSMSVLQTNVLIRSCLMFSSAYPASPGL